MKKILSVYQVNNYIKRIFEEDFILSEVFIQGEISNLKHNKHFYFTLKGDNSAINCVMFNNYTKSLDIELKDGMSIIVFGRISVYEKTGNYQIYVELIQPIGVGIIHFSFLQLKEKLEKEGLFDLIYKKDIPKDSKNIAFITSLTGAVVYDMIRILKRRNPSINILIVPVQVQGKDAPISIINALKTLEEYRNVDFAILARGGGSIEDLWAFNDENVARAIFNFKIPIISAIGHETDFTIADFVSDLRASTPSSAIEVSVSQKEDILKTIKIKISRLNNIISMKINMEKRLFLNFLERCKALNPEHKVLREKKYVSEIVKNIDTIINNDFEKHKNKLAFNISILKAISPLNILSKGYTIVYKDEKIVKSAENLKKDDEIIIKFENEEKHAKII